MVIKDDTHNNYIHGMKDLALSLIKEMNIDLKFKEIDAEYNNLSNTVGIRFEDLDNISMTISQYKFMINEYIENIKNGHIKIYTTDHEDKKIIKYKQLIQPADWAGQIGLLQKWLIRNRKEILEMMIDAKYNIPCKNIYKNTKQCPLSCNFNKGIIWSTCNKKDEIDILKSKINKTR